MTATTPEILDCGHAESAHSEYTRGYGRDADGKRHCLDCCHARDLAGIRAAEPFVGYLTEDENGRLIISNWPGYALLKVVRHWPVSNNWVQRGYTSNRLYHIQAIDAQGRAWYGRGLGRDSYCRMRPAKATVAAARVSTIGG